MKKWLLNDRELAALGYVRDRDGVLLDNRDGFFEDHPDPIRTYDSRTHIAVSRSLLWKLIDAALAPEERPESKEAA